MAIINEFELSTFFKDNFQLFVILGIFGAFTLYLKGFLVSENLNIILEYGIISSFIIAILISLLIIRNSFENISFNHDSFESSLETFIDVLQAIFLVGKGNILRGLFLIPFIFFIITLISTIFTSFSSKLPSLFSAAATIITTILFFNLFQYLVDIKKNWNTVANYLVGLEIVSIALLAIIHLWFPSFSELAERLVSLMIGFPLGALAGIFIAATIEKLGFLGKYTNAKQRKKKKNY
nr:hypothetical protein [uncultured Methanoregula sp.]